jgi:hypothetical protein
MRRLLSLLCLALARGRVGEPTNGSYTNPAGTRKSGRVPCGALPDFPRGGTINRRFPLPPR